MGCLRGDLLLRLVDDDDIRLRDLGTVAASRIVRQHDDNLDTTDTRTHQDVLLGAVLVDDARITGLDHVAIAEAHDVGTLGTSLTADSNLATTGTRLHDETDDTVASTTHGKTLQELVLERLALCHGAETTVEDTLDIELDLAVTEAETLLDDGGKLTDALTVLTKNRLGASGTDDDLCASGSVANLDTSKTTVDEHAVHELVKLAVENSICNKLPLLGQTQSSSHFSSFL